MAATRASGKAATEAGARQGGQRAVQRRVGPQVRADAAGVLALQAAAGNRAVSGLMQQARGNVQAKGGAAGADIARVHEAAKRGTSGSGGALPHLQQIQRAFGRHDVTGVQAHAGAQAKAGAQAMGAQAFAMGNHVAFAGSADLRTAAHEAAHVVQQRAGVQLAGGVGQAGDRYEQHADAVAAAVVSGRSAEALLDAHASGSRGGGASAQRQVQQIRIGPDTIATVAALAPALGITQANVLERFNAALGADFPAATVGQLNGLLAAKTGKVAAGKSDLDAFFLKLANHYKNQYFATTDANFAHDLGGIKQNPAYRTLVDPGGINYADGVDDGAAVGDVYDVALACSLFALLELRPNFLGAATPRQLHRVFRSNPKTRAYDNDREVAQIRIAAGLHYRQPAQNERTVSTFVATLNVGDRNRRFIIDPDGQAHTFALVFHGGSWKKFDNDNQGGVNPGNPAIRVIWE